MEKISSAQNGMGVLEVGKYLVTLLASCGDGEASIVFSTLSWARVREVRRPANVRRNVK